jgi:hypothetical protein
MSICAWYRDKADQCARLAKNASELDRRYNYEAEEKAWRLIADQIDANERNQFASDPA